MRKELNSMEKVYQKLLDNGFQVTIDENSSFISVVVDNYTVCGDDDLITLKCNDGLYEENRHVLCSDEDEIYGEIYDIFMDYIQNLERYKTKVDAFRKSYCILGFVFSTFLIIGIYLIVR